MSDFPEFDKAYRTVLMKDQNDKFEQLASEANFNVYHSDIWRGTGRKFAELIVRECLGIVDDAERGGSNEEWDNAVKFIRRDLQEHFGVEDIEEDTACPYREKPYET